MRYCIYCGTPHEDNEVCGCEEARAERRRKAEAEKNKKNNTSDNPFSQLMGLYSMFSDADTDSSEDSDTETDKTGDAYDALSSLFGSAFASAFGTPAAANNRSAEEKNEWNTPNTSFGAKETFDVFKHIDLYYIGKSGCADAHIRYLSRGGIISACKFDIEPSSELSNGDRVTVSLLNADELEDRFDVKFERREYTFTVGYLEEAKHLDAFEEIDVIFTGISGEGEVSIFAKDENSNAFCCDFSIEPSSNLSNGDVVKITITNRDQLIHAFGIVPKELVRSYTVNTLTEHVTSPSDLDKRAVSEIGRQYFEMCSLDSYTYKNYKYDGAYLFVKRSPSSTPRYGNSRLEFVVGFDHMNGEKLLGRSHEIFCFPELLHLPGQKAVLDPEKSENDRIVGDLDRYLNDEGEVYHIYKVD